MARGMKELDGALASRRAAAFGRAKVAVDFPRYRSLLLDTLQWLENGDWAKRSRRESARPIERVATLMSLAGTFVDTIAYRAR